MMQCTTDEIGPLTCWQRHQVLRNRASPRNVGAPGRLITCSPLTPIFSKRVQPPKELTNIFESACPKCGYYSGKFACGNRVYWQYIYDYTPHNLDFRAAVRLARLLRTSGDTNPGARHIPEHRNPQTTPLRNPNLAG